MMNHRLAPLEQLLTAFEPGVTLEQIERRYHAGTLEAAQVSAAAEIFLRAERMTGHDFRIDASTVANTRPADG